MKNRIIVFSSMLCLATLCQFIWLGKAIAETPDTRALYKMHCARCHGDTGIGDGPASTMQRPWPRDFTTGQYKFRSTPPNVLPTVADVMRTIAKGNLRTSMPPFENILTKTEIRDLAKYVLDISRKESDIPDGHQRRIERPMSLDREMATPEILKRGGLLFQRNCVTCHGDNGRGLGVLSPHLRDENNFWLQLPDLTDAHTYGGGSRTSDIYMRLKTGIPLSRMPAYDGILDDESIQAIAHYVKSIQIAPEERTLISTEEWSNALPAQVRGEYMVRAMTCALCHNSYDERGYYYPDLYMAGGVAITLPGLGVYPSKNITSHPEDGIGGWTEEEIIRTVTTGYAPDRRIEAFSMPWVFFSHLDPEDARDIAVYVKSLAPIDNKVPKRKMYPVHERLWSRLKHALGVEHGRLIYPPFNVGEREKQND